MEPSVSLTVRISNNKDKISEGSDTYIVYAIARYSLKGGYIKRRLTHCVMNLFYDDRSLWVVAPESAESSY